MLVPIVQKTESQYLKGLLCFGSAVDLRIAHLQKQKTKKNKNQAGLSFVAFPPQVIWESEPKHSPISLSNAGKI